MGLFQNVSSSSAGASVTVFAALGVPAKKERTRNADHELPSFAGFFIRSKEVAIFNCEVTAAEKVSPADVLRASLGS